MANTAPQKAEYVARLFKPTTQGYEVIAKFATGEDWQAWEMQMQQEHPDWEFGYDSHYPWDDSQLGRISARVSATSKPKVLITRPTAVEDS